MDERRAPCIEETDHGRAHRGTARRCGLLRGCPYDYGIQREWTVARHQCVVVAPSLIQRKRGDRIKTHRDEIISPSCTVRGS